MRDQITKSAQPWKRQTIGSLQSNLDTEKRLSLCLQIRFCGLPSASLNISAASGFRHKIFWAASINEMSIFFSSAWNWNGEKTATNVIVFENECARGRAEPQGFPWRRGIEKQWHNPVSQKEHYNRVHLHQPQGQVHESPLSAVSPLADSLLLSWSVPWWQPVSFLLLAERWSQPITRLFTAQCEFSSFCLFSLFFCRFSFRRWPSDLSHTLFSVGAHCVQIQIIETRTKFVPSFSCLLAKDACDSNPPGAGVLFFSNKSSSAKRDKCTVSFLHCIADCFITHGDVLTTQALNFSLQLDGWWPVSGFVFVSPQQCT